jgi:hypothetical protein
MNRTDTAVSALKEELADLQRQIDSLRQRQSTIEKAITLLSSNDSLDMFEISEPLLRQAVGPVDAIRHILKRESKESPLGLTPVELRARLEDLRQRQLLDSSGKDLLQTTHWALRQLHEMGELILTDTAPRKRYQLAELL